MVSPSFSARYIAATVEYGGRCPIEAAPSGGSPTMSAATVGSRSTAPRRVVAGPTRARSYSRCPGRASRRRGAAQRGPADRHSQLPKETHIMRDIANVTLSGNLTREVELRELPSGTHVTRLRVASTTRRRHGEEWIDKTNYFTVEVYESHASLC